jgi:hypothetical protein
VVVEKQSGKSCRSLRQEICLFKTTTKPPACAIDHPSIIRRCQRRPSDLELLISSRGPLLRTYLYTPRHFLFTYRYSVDSIDNTKKRKAGFIMRLMLLVLPLVLLLGAVSWAQTSSSMEASPAPMASPGPSGGMMGQPPMGWPHHAYPPWCGFHRALLAPC